MANTLLTPSLFAMAGLDILESGLVFGNKVRTDLSSEFAMAGDTISIRRPTQYLGQADNLDLTGVREDIVQGKTTIQMNKTLSVGIDMGAIDKTLSFDRIQEDVIAPVIQRFVDAIETAIAGTYPDFYWFDGTPGTVPATFLSLANAGAIMFDASIPSANRFAIHSPTAAATLADGVKNVYVQDKAKTAYEKAQIGFYGGFDNIQSAFAPTHTVGVATGTPTVNGASQNVTYLASKDTWTQSIITTAWTASTAGIVKRGDILTFAGCFSVNPNTKVSTGRLQTFTVTADATSAGAGATTITISPPMITTGAYQTVSAAPANGAAILVKTGTGGTAYRQSLLAVPDAIALVSRPLNIAQGAGVKTATKAGNKVTISATEFMNGNTLVHTMRFDMLYGVKVLDPRLGLRLTN
jgi:hypothetical protein